MIWLSRIAFLLKLSWNHGSYPSTGPSNLNLSTKQIKNVSASSKVLYLKHQTSIIKKWSSLLRCSNSAPLKLLPAAFPSLRRTWMLWFEPSSMNLEFIIGTTLTRTPPFVAWRVLKSTNSSSAWRGLSRIWPLATVPFFNVLPATSILPVRSLNLHSSLLLM